MQVRYELIEAGTFPLPVIRPANECMNALLFPVEMRGSRSCNGTIKNGGHPYRTPWCGESMIQDFDLTARWSTLLHAHFTEDVHNIAQLWPDVQSLEVSYRTIEGFDPTFAQSILEQPDLHDAVSYTHLTLPTKRIV